MASIFTYNISLTPHNNSIMHVSLLVFYRWENLRSKLLNSLPKATQLVREQIWDSIPGCTRSKLFFSFQHVPIPGCSLLQEKEWGGESPYLLPVEQNFFFSTIPINYGAAIENFLEAFFLSSLSKAFAFSISAYIFWDHELCTSFINRLYFLELF